MRTRRVIAAGEPLRPPAIEVPPLVRAGQAVELTVAADDVRITMRGIAATDAGRGDRVWVRVDAARRFHGTVTDSGRVTALLTGPRS
jgi:flagella basal body P-ring formation protein FlgA